MHSKCPICFMMVTEDCAVTPCAHIFHGFCIDRWCKEKNKGSKRTSFPCPSCMQTQAMAKIIRPYVNTASSSPPASSPAPSDGAMDALDVDEDDDENARDEKLAQIDRCSDKLRKKAEKMVNSEADVLSIVQMTQELEFALISWRDLDQHVKKSCGRFLRVMQLVLQEHFIPTVAQIDALKGENSELSDEVANMAESIDAKNGEIESLKAKHRQQVTAMHQDNDKRLQEQQSSAKHAMRKVLDTRQLYDELQKELKATKAEVVSMRTSTTELRNDNEWLREMLTRQKQLLEAKINAQAEQIKALERAETKSPPLSEFSNSQPLSTSSNSEPSPSPSVPDSVPRSGVQPSLSDMPWKREKRPNNLPPPPSRPLKVARTDQVGPHKLVQGKLTGVAILGSRQKGLDRICV